MDSNKNVKWFESMRLKINTEIDCYAKSTKNEFKKLDNLSSTIAILIL